MYPTIKRTLDFICTALGLILLTPFLAPVALFLRFTGEGEVLYLQERVGYLKKPFGIIKFATMLKDSANIGSKTITTRNDPRITRAGKILRMTKINELPQILNVIKGEMSLVGPRPLLPASFAKYTQEVQDIIAQQRPGITGIGSLVFRDEEKLVTHVKASGMDPLEYYKNHIYPYKGALEVWYAHNISFVTDTKILFLTFWYVVFSKSEAVFKIFKSLPPRPESLTVEGITRNIVASK